MSWRGHRGPVGVIRRTPWAAAMMDEGPGAGAGGRSLGTVGTVGTSKKTPSQTFSTISHLLGNLGWGTPNVDF